MNTKDLKPALIHALDRGGAEGFLIAVVDMIDCYNAGSDITDMTDAVHSLAFEAHRLILEDGRRDAERQDV